MDKKQTGIIAVILLLLIVAGSSYFLFFSQPQYKNITMNGVTMEVPESNITVQQQTDIYSYYNDSDNNINIFVLDTTEFGLSDMSEAFTFAALREMFQVGATQQSKDGVEFNYSESTKVYSHVTNFTHKNVLIVTGSEEDMIHIVKSLNVDQQESVNETGNTTNETPKTVTKNKTNTEDTLKEEREDEQVIDGWDPKEHEVSRESLDDDLERVTYDDGYSRVVDKKGNIQSYGY